MLYHRYTRQVGLLLMLLGGLGALLGPAPARAAATTFNVTSVKDEPDKAPGNGRCQTQFGSCTLRAAIMESNALTGVQEIVLPADPFELTRPGFDDDGFGGDLDITASVKIRGAGVGRTTLVGETLGSRDRVLHVTARRAVVEITGITIESAHLDDALVGDGGAGILNRGRLTLKNVSLIGNYSDYGVGAAIANYGALTLERVVMSGNSGRGDGGALYNEGTATLRGVTLSGNIVFNRGSGGGIYNYGTLDVSGSTISANQTDGDGGGIFNSGELTIVNSTISGNATERYGGGILNIATATVSSATITANHSDSDLDGYGRGGGVYNSHVFTFNNSIIAVNWESFENGGDDYALLSDCGGTIVSQGTNLLQAVYPDRCTIQGHTSNGDDDVTLINNPELGPLRNNGGATATHALQRDSQAIDAATNRCPSTDQRGRRRADGDGDGSVRCDLGAYEYKGR